MYITIIQKTSVRKKNKVLFVHVIFQIAVVCMARQTERQ